MRTGARLPLLPRNVTPLAVSRQTQRRLATNRPQQMPHEPTVALSREVREVVAESVAYAVGSRFGLDLALRSTTYVASWLDDPAAFRAGMAAIHDGAASLIDAAEAALAPADALDLAA